MFPFDALSGFLFGRVGRSVGGFDVREVTAVDGNPIKSVRYKRLGVQGGSVNKKVQKVQLLVNR